MKTPRRVLRAVASVAIIVALLAPSAQATSFSTDQSDLWYIKAEAGWGMQLVQRDSVIFATLFVYGPGGASTWYVATMQAVGNLVWSGDLYATTGPWFGTVPFNPGAVIPSKVGTMTWTAQTVDTGNVSYTVNGVAVSKDVVRQALALDDFRGHYYGLAHRELTNCNNPALNGITEMPFVRHIFQTGQAISVRTFDTSGSPTCTFTGTLTQNGQMGTVRGTFVCADGGAGDFTWSEFQVNISGMSGRSDITYSTPPGCQSTGWFGGVAVTTY